MKSNKSGANPTQGNQPDRLPKLTEDIFCYHEGAQGDSRLQASIEEAFALVRRYLGVDRITSRPAPPVDVLAAVLVLASIRYVPMHSTDDQLRLAAVRALLKPWRFTDWSVECL